MRRFRQREDGTVLTEFVIVLPLLIWAWAALFGYWDAYSASNRMQKATLNVADALSRSAGAVDAPTLNGMKAFFDFMNRTGDPSQLRFTNIQWTDTDNSYKVLWSYSPGGQMSPLTDADLVTMQAQIPDLVDLETLLIVESKVEYRAPLTASSIGGLLYGLGDRNLSEFVATRPRFMLNVCFSGVPCS